MRSRLCDPRPVPGARSESRQLTASTQQVSHYTHHSTCTQLTRHALVTPASRRHVIAVHRVSRMEFRSVSGPNPGWESSPQRHELRARHGKVVVTWLVSPPPTELRRQLSSPTCGPQTTRVSKTMVNCTCIIWQMLCVTTEHRSSLGVADLGCRDCAPLWPSPIVCPKSLLSRCASCETCKCCKTPAIEAVDASVAPPTKTERASVYAYAMTQHPPPPPPPPPISFLLPMRNSASSNHNSLFM